MVIIPFLGYYRRVGRCQGGVPDVVPDGSKVLCLKLDGALWAGLDSLGFGLLDDE
jgi:hypothetical protein